MNTLHTIAFTVYPYVCLAFFLMGSLARFDRDQYTWKSDSSQLLRAGQLRWGSNLFHGGILFLFFGHTVGMLTPHFVYEPFISAGAKQLVAMISGGAFGVLGLLGLTLLLHRRLFDVRIRSTSKTSDIALLVVLWLQFALGIATVPLSAQHLDGSMMMVLAEWAQRIVTFRGGAAELMAEVGPDGHYFGVQHTQDRYTQAFYQPIVSDWRNFEAWQIDGAVWTAERAHRIFKEILLDYEEPPMDAGAKDELKDFVARRKVEGGAPTDF